MPRVHEVPSDHPDFLALQRESTLPPDRCLVARARDGVRARASYHLTEGLVGVPGPCGLVGHYEAADPSAGVAVLRGAVDRLLESGAVRVLGPMDGSTWGRYRLAREVDPVPEPRFATEPANPPEYLHQFTRAGFAPDSVYESRQASASGGPAPGPLPAGVEDRAFDPSRLEEQLADLHRASLAAFADNLYYRPLPLDGFLALYRPLVARLEPELVRTLRTPHGEMAAYVLAFPDHLAPERRRVVLKTLATVPGWRGRGLGGWLTRRVHELAARRGYRHVIHALMHVANPSGRISRASDSRLIREYVLFRHEP